MDTPHSHRLTARMLRQVSCECDTQAVSDWDALQNQNQRIFLASELILKKFVSFASEAHGFSIGYKNKGIKE